MTEPQFLALKMRVRDMSNGHVEHITEQMLRTDTTRADRLRLWPDMVTKLIEVTGDQSELIEDTVEMSEHNAVLEHNDSLQDERDTLEHKISSVVLNMEGYLKDLTEDEIANSRDLSNIAGWIEDLQA